jgi:pimeloyl-ACP methyl ester carboxylesterase
MKRVIQTSVGQIWLHAENWDPPPGLPAVLAITGSFSDPRQLGRLQFVLPQAWGLRAHLPGNHSPVLRDWEPATMVRAFDEVVASLERTTIVCGVSLGGLVAMGLTAPNLAAVVAVDPPLDNQQLGELGRRFAIHLAQNADNPAITGFLGAFYGVTPGGLEPRDHIGQVAATATPLTVIEPSAGGVLSDEARRALAQRRPATFIRSTAQSHNIPHEDPTAIVAELRRLVGRLAPPREPPRDPPPGP